MAVRRCNAILCPFGSPHRARGCGPSASGLLWSIGLGVVWTFFRACFDRGQAKPVMTVLSSREYTEKTEATTVLTILESIVAKVEPLI